MTRDQAIQRLIEIFILDADEYAMNAFTEKAAKDAEQALNMLTDKHWYAFPTGDADRWVLQHT